MLRSSLWPLSRSSGKLCEQLLVCPLVSHPEALMQGYVFKRGGFMSSSWKRRYVHLWADRLEWRTEQLVNKALERDIKGGGGSAGGVRSSSQDTLLGFFSKLNFVASYLCSKRQGGCCRCQIAGLLRKAAALAVPSFLWKRSARHSSFAMRSGD